ncbi:ATP-dependent DNA helicase RecG [Schaalia suimastitidis]|uniref:ATP-dependent DNA helicase RecG n=1 Tax=Schaalia suimastitidis TaxID=121163 RepID=UPI0003F8F645|nr:ATP-dependent DNA helicase RecG [Schaalia suimastitidis]
MSELLTPLDLRLPARVAKKFAAVGIDTVGDLLAIAPRRYYHWGRLTSMRALREGEDVTLLAEVVSQRLVANRNRGGVRLEVVLTDGSETMSATFFAANEYKLIPHRAILKVGEQFLFAGKVGSYRGKLQLTHPEFEGADGDATQFERAWQRPIPIYPAGKGLTSWVIARSVGMLLDSIDEATCPDPLPADLRKKYALPTYAQTFQLLHRPENDEEQQRARRGLAWREAYILQLALLASRLHDDAQTAPVSFRRGNAVLAATTQALPFRLTQAQNDALATIGAELESAQPAQRLLQADVGAGKTAVALLALAQVIGAGHQGALLAPTEVLAEQHATSLKALLVADHSGASNRGADGHGADHGVDDHAGEVLFPLHLLTASTPPAQRRAILTDLEQGTPCLVVGTHALVQDGIEFADLALVVVDEQHRFGVAQRDKLRNASHSGTPHQIVMTATPIPRTVAMTIFGDLEESRMEGLPPGRSPVTTHLVNAANTQWIDRLWARAREEIDQGGRVYVVCPRIDADDASNGTDNLPHSDVEPRGADGGWYHDEDSLHGNIAQSDDGVDGGRSTAPLASVETMAAQLAVRADFADIDIACLSGRDSAEVKQETMRRFASGASPLLVATTVVEVGIDVPEATMMVIVDAQQFGLSQLHQLRGRVGRSHKAGICMAIHRDHLGATALARLDAFASTTNGFELAEADLKLRREGDVLGADQSGRTSTLKYLSVLRDGDIIRQARDEAQRLLQADPMLDAHPLLRSVLSEHNGGVRWLSRS